MSNAPPVGSREWVKELRGLVFAQANSEDFFVCFEDVLGLLDAFERRDWEAKQFCKAYNKSLQTIVGLKKRLGEDPGDY